MVSAFETAAQENYVFHHLTYKDGLGSEYIHSIFQDSKGFYWIGTTSGLQKFDGYTFSKPLTFGTDVLGSSTVTETREGILWISTGTSLFRYNRATEHFMELHPPGIKPKLDLRVFEDTTGEVWLLNAQFVYKYDQKNEKLIVWLKLPAFEQGMTSGATAYDRQQNIIWIQNGTSLYKIFPLAKKIEFVETMLYQAAAMWTDGTSFLWISFWTQYLCRYNVRTGEKKWFTMPYKVRGSKISILSVAKCFSRDQKGRMWIGSIDGGLWYFDNLSDTMTRVETDNTGSSQFHYMANVYAITTDKVGNIWVGSDRGLNIFNPNVQRFYSLQNKDLPTGEVLSEIAGRPFETSTGDIMVGTTFGGWLHFDSRFSLKRKYTADLKAKSLKIERYKTIVSCFAEDKSGNIWIGHSGGIIGVYQPATGVTLYHQVPEFNEQRITNIKCDALGNMWFAVNGLTNNLAKWDPKSKRYSFYNVAINGQRQLSCSIVITRDGDIWLGSLHGGLCRFDPVTEKVVERYYDDQLPARIPTELHEISVVDDSTLLLATYAKGFIFFNYNQKKTVLLGTTEGLPSNLARGLARDQTGNFWIATLSDLVRMNPTTKKIISFGDEEGILNRGFAYGFVRLKDGRLLMTSSTGILYFYPDSIKSKPAPSDVMITGLKILNKAVLIDTFLNSSHNKIRLSHKDNFLTIDYVSVSYLVRKDLKYFYKLDGLEDKWVESGSQRTAAYTNLSPGKYVFMVRCQNEDGISSEHTTQLIIIISPPWWRTWWAYVLYFVLAGGIFFLVYRNHISQLKKKQQDEIKAMIATQEEERKRISRDLHDDVGTKLSALKFFVSSLHDKAVAINNEEIQSLARSSEQFITEAMQDVRQLLLNLSPSVLEEFGYTTAVEGLVNKINETRRIQFTLVIFGMTARIKKEYELILYRITQELINNVLKHSGAKNVSLQIGLRDYRLILMIEDDGKGFDLAQRSEGYGLQNLRARTRLMQGSITIDSGPGKGTSILIEIPYRDV